MRVGPSFLLAVTAVAGLLAASCGSDDSRDPGSSTVAIPGGDVSGDITVFAAASLTAAYTEIGEAFMVQHPGAEVTFSFAASSELVTQIDEGAPADVFASADEANMTKLTAAEANAGEPAVFATNSLQIIVEPGNPQGITEVADLADPNVLYVTCSPEVPIGGYAAQVLANAGVTASPVSFEENVKGIVTKVTLGEVDAGIVYRTDVQAAGAAAEGVDIPADIGVEARYPIVAIADAGNPAGAAAFVDFVLSEPGQEILAGYGFGAP